MNKDLHYWGMENLRLIKIDYGKPASDKDSANVKKMHQENFLEIIITCPKIIKISNEHMEQGSFTVKMY